MAIEYSSGDDDGGFSQMLSMFANKGDKKKKKDGIATNLELPDSEMGKIDPVYLQDQSSRVLPNEFYNRDFKW